MNKYIAEVEVAGALHKIKFETNDNPIEYLWQRYGVSSYIASLVDLDEVAGQAKTLEKKMDDVIKEPENILLGLTTEPESEPIIVKKIEV